MNVDEWKCVMHEMRSCGGANAVTLSGGEPLLYPGFFELIRAIDEFDVKNLQVFTNASLIDEKTIEGISALKGATEICASISGRSTYANVTGGICDYISILGRISLCVSTGLPVFVSSILTAENFTEIEDVARDCFSAGAEGIQFGYVMREGAALENRDLWLSLCQRIEILQRIRALKRMFPDKTIMFSDESACWCNSLALRFVAKACGRKCTMGTSSIVVSPDGYVRPCVHESGRKPFKMFTQDQRGRFEGAVNGKYMW